MFYRRYGKRLFDLALALPGLVLLSPLLCLIAAAIKLTSRGPVFYVQERIGRDAAPFPFIKFRTMVVGAESQGAGILCLKDDPRVTRVGRVLRRFSLDEVPQLVNVVRGEMSLIGPRPGLAYQLRGYTPFQRRRLTVLPGITGWAQVNGRNALSWEDKFALDVWYVDHQSFGLDCKILWLTLLKVLKREGIQAAHHATMPRFAGSPESIR
jgi:sugar transferase EpsL